VRNAGSYSQMVEYHMGIRDEVGNHLEAQNRGKALRATLCLLTADAFMGADWQQAVPAAAALELFHNFTLIHDDIQDGDIERYGRPSVWSVYGVAQGINIGDVAHLLSGMALSDLQNYTISAKTVLAAKGLLEQTGLELVQGQILDFSFEQNLDVTKEAYLAMISQKTGALITCSILMGALLGKAPMRVRKQLRLYGRHLGRVFQISDDRLGIWGDSKKMGKPVGSDIIHRKKTLPIILGLTAEDERIRTEMRRVYQQDKTLLDADDITRVMDLLDAAGVQEQMTAALDTSYTAAVEAIETVDIGWAKADFLSLAHALTYRER
jgi:geranylgeranyl diphosphate synthase type I